jgi:trimeric autotransporter adhesin
VAEPLLRRMEQWRALIRPYVERERETERLTTLEQFDRAMTSPAGPAPGLGPFVTGRLAAVRNQLAALTIPPAGAFTVSAGQRRIQLDSSGIGTTPSYSLFATTEQGGNWLTVSLANGTLPATLTLTKNETGLAAGVYRGMVTVHVAGAANSPVRLPVTMTVGGPELKEMVNAASYAVGAVAPGEIVTLFGTGLGPASLTTEGVNVFFDGQPARLIYARADQVGAVVPMELAGQNVTSVQVHYRGQRSESLRRAVVAATPGIFTAGSAGSGQGAIVNETGTVNSAAAPAEKGSTVAIYLTGAGLTDGDGEIAAPVTVRIGGVETTVRYAGAAPGSIVGLYQINAVVPPSVTGGAIPVVVTVGGAESQSGVTVSVR